MVQLSLSWTGHTCIISSTLTRCSRIIPNILFVDVLIHKTRKLTSRFSRSSTSIFERSLKNLFLVVVNKTNLSISLRMFLTQSEYKIFTLFFISIKLHCRPPWYRHEMSGCGCRSLSVAPLIFYVFVTQVVIHPSLSEVSTWLNLLSFMLSMTS